MGLAMSCLVVSGWFSPAMGHYESQKSCLVFFSGFLLQWIFILFGHGVCTLKLGFPCEHKKGAWASDGVVSLPASCTSISSL
jgi:hypothetical protein